MTDRQLIAKVNNKGLIRLLAIQSALGCSLPEAQERAKKMVKDGIISTIARSMNYCTRGYQHDISEVTS